jgi:pseudouridine-5'-phosphate glycosidase
MNVSKNASKNASVEVIENTVVGELVDESTETIIEAESAAMVAGAEAAVIADELVLDAPLESSAELLGQVEGQIAENETFAVAVVQQIASKAALGRTIWDRELLKVQGDGTKLVRKDLIAMLIAEAGCTKTGAATYYQNMKNKAGLVNHKTA